MRRGQAIIIIWAALALLCTYAAHLAKGGMPLAQTTFSWKGACVSYGKCSSSYLDGEDISGFAVWDDMGGYAKYRGDWRLLTGGSLISGQPGGLMVSRETALSLYGSYDVVGREADIGGNVAVIRGVYDEGVSGALIESDSDGPYRNATAAFSGKPTATWRESAREFFTAAGLESPDYVTDCALWHSFTDGSAFYALTPTRWADFEGWERNLTALGESVQAFFTGPLTPCAWKTALTALMFFAYASCAAISAFHVFVSSLCGRFTDTRITS